MIKQHPHTTKNDDTDLPPATVSLPPQVPIKSLLYLFIWYWEQNTGVQSGKHSITELYPQIPYLFAFKE